MEPYRKTELYYRGRRRTGRRTWRKRREGEGKKDRDDELEEEVGEEREEETVDHVLHLDSQI